MRRILVIVSAVCFLAPLSVTTVGRAADTEAEQAAKEIVDARERANAAADAYFASESRIDQLTLQQDQLQSEITALEGDVKALKLSVENVAIVVSSWVDSDAGAVSRWLNALPAGAFYEAAATAFSQAAAEKSPADAILWARSLAKPENREQAVIYAMELWIEKDRHGFVDALPAQLEATTDPALRKAIYDMLYRKDPGFKESLLNLAEEPAGR